jgi:hypothetical protein
MGQEYHIAIQKEEGDRTLTPVVASQQREMAA